MASSEDKPDTNAGPPKIVLGQGSIEISKQLIGCGGGVVTALITGIFLLIANSGIMNRLITPAPEMTATSVISAPISTLTLSATLTPQPATESAAIGPLTFAAGIWGTDPIESGTRFPQGIRQIYAIFSYENLRTGTPWRSELFFNNKLHDQMADVWKGPPLGIYTVWQNMPNGFPAGEWEWRIYLNDSLAQKEKFTIVAPLSDAAYFDTIQFAADFNNGQPIDPYFNGYFLFAGGTKQITAYFRPVNISRGSKWESRWYLNGDPIPGATYTTIWDDIPTPSHYSSAQLSDPIGLTQGTYTLKLTIDGKLVQLTTIMVLPPTSTDATQSPTSAPLATSETGNPGNAVYGPFTFAAGVANKRDPIEQSSTFPQSTTQIVALYAFRLDLNSKWREEWYHNDQVYSAYDGIWQGDTQGIARSWLRDVSGLPAGKWMLKSYVEGTLIQTGTFMISGVLRGQSSFGAITFAEDIKDGQPANPLEHYESFPLDTTQIAAYFVGVNVGDETEWTEQWDFNGKMLSSIKHKGAQDSEASQYLTARLSSLQKLPAGTYTLKLLITGRIAQLATVVVGQ